MTSCYVVFGSVLEYKVYSQYYASFSLYVNQYLS